MPQDLDAGQARQVQAMEQLEAQGVTIGGWKLGQTSGESRDAFGPGYRAFGFVRADRIYHDGDVVSWAQVTPGQIETELCLVLQDDLVGEITATDARSSVLLAAGFELNQKRLGKDAATAERIADNLSNYGIVVGTPVPVPFEWQPEEMTVKISNGASTISEVAARGHIDDHFETLAVLANKLQRYGRKLSKGDYVITGAFGRVPEPQPGLWTGSFSGIGHVSVEIAP